MQPPSNSGYGSYYSANVASRHLLTVCQVTPMITTVEIQYDESATWNVRNVLDQVPLPNDVWHLVVFPGLEIWKTYVLAQGLYSNTMADDIMGVGRHNTTLILVSRQRCRTHSTRPPNGPAGTISTRHHRIFGHCNPFVSSGPQSALTEPPAERARCRDLLPNPCWEGSPRKHDHPVQRYHERPYHGLDISSSNARHIPRSNHTRHHSDDSIWHIRPDGGQPPKPGLGYIPERQYDRARSNRPDGRPGGFFHGESRQRAVAV